MFYIHFPWGRDWLRPTCQTPSDTEELCRELRLRVARSARRLKSFRLKSFGMPFILWECSELCTGIESNPSFNDSPPPRSGSGTRTGIRSTVDSSVREFAVGTPLCSFCSGADEKKNKTKMLLPTMSEELTTSDCSKCGGTLPSAWRGAAGSRLTARRHSVHAIAMDVVCDKPANSKVRCTTQKRGVTNARNSQLGQDSQSVGTHVV